jgi:hypothetical protein
MVMSAKLQIKAGQSVVVEGRPKGRERGEEPVRQVAIDECRSALRFWTVK